MYVASHANPAVRHSSACSVLVGCSRQQQSQMQGERWKELVPSEVKKLFTRLVFRSTPSLSPPRSFPLEHEQFEPIRRFGNGFHWVCTTFVFTSFIPTQLKYLTFWSTKCIPQHAEGQEICPDFSKLYRGLETISFVLMRNNVVSEKDAASCLLEEKPGSS